MTESSKARLFVIRALVLSLLLTLFGRLWYLQVVSGAKYLAQVSSNSERQQFTPAVRGRILDDEGVELVRNKTALVISVNASDLPDKSAAKAAVLDRLVPLVNLKKIVLNEGRIAAMITPCGPGPNGHPVPLPCWTGEPFAPVPVATFVLDGKNNDLLNARALTIKQDAADFPGVSVDLRAVSDYPVGGAIANTTLAAQTLGYVRPVVDEDVAHHPEYLQPRDTIGTGGLEGSYDKDLRGTPGLLKLRVDAAGNETETLGNTQQIPGSDLVTNLDTTIQKASEAALQKAVTVTAPSFGKHPTSGAAVVMTTDGRIVALASYPSFNLGATLGSSQGIDDTAYAALNDPNGTQPVLNRATSGQYSPGSSWKIVSASTALGNGLIHPGDTLDCPQPLKIGNVPFKNFEGEEPGPGTLIHMLTVSCDTVWDKLAYDEWLSDGAQRAVNGLPPAKEIFAKGAQAYGFGKTTGADIGEVPGSILDRASLATLAAALKPAACARVEKLKAAGDTTSDLYKLSVNGCGPDAAYLQGGDAAQFAIGQGADVAVTPLQMARAYAALANGGKLYAPTLGKAIVRPDGSLVRKITPQQTGTLPESAEELDYIRQGLYGVTHAKDGTAVGVFGSDQFPIPIAGKTGTAEVSKLDPVTKQLLPVGDNSWFMSFGPYTPEKPNAAQYVVGVVIPDSDQGARVAAPAAKDIWSAIYGVTGEGKKAKVGNPLARAPQLLPCYVAGKTHPSKPSKTCVVKPTVTAPPLAPPGFVPYVAPGAAAPSPSGTASALDPLLPALAPEGRQRTRAGQPL